MSVLPVVTGLQLRRVSVITHSHGWKEDFIMTSSRLTFRLA